MSTTTTSPSSTPPPRSRRSSATLPLPPGPFGFPLIGRTLPLVQDTHAFLTRERQRYGDIFHLGFMGERGAQHAAVVFGRDAQAEALLDNERFPAAPGYAFSRPTLGDSLLMSDGPRHVAQRRLIQPAFASSLYGAYLARLEEALGTVLATWSTGSPGSPRRAKSSQRAFYRSFYRDAEAIMFRLACRIILGATDAEPSSGRQGVCAYARQVGDPAGRRDQPHPQRVVLALASSHGRRALAGQTDDRAPARGSRRSPAACWVSSPRSAIAAPRRGRRRIRRPRTRASRSTCVCWCLRPTARPPARHQGRCSRSSAAQNGGSAYKLSCTPTGWERR